MGRLCGTLNVVMIAVKLLWGGGGVGWAGRGAKLSSREPSLGENRIESQA